VAALYDRARPPYPAALVDDLAALTGLGSGTRVLEIGPGTGHLSVPLAERGAALLGVELGARLAEIARRRLAPFPDAEIVVADFDRWAAPPAAFDLVVAATAFHWLAPATRVARCVEALRPGGALAVVHVTWGVGRDPFTLASQACSARWDPEHDPAYVPPTLADLPDRRDELAPCGRVEHRRYPCPRTYTARAFCDLLATFSDARALDDAARRGFLACIGDLIGTRFGGSVERQDVYDLYVAWPGG